MFWADRLATEIRKTRRPKNGSTYIVRDEKTMSGRVHVGSMRSVAVHGLVADVLNAAGTKTEFVYEINDFDPFDSVPGYLDQGVFKAHIGKPLYAVPSPEPGYKNYAEYFADEFQKVHAKAGFTPRYYRATELYRSGKMDDLMRTALTRSDDIRRILKEVSGSQKEEGWLPVFVVCESCGKIMTTRTSDFDGKTVAYTCDKKSEATPCGHTGRVSPFGGGGKFFWKVDWAAKWIAVGVDAEGGGKDHSTKGGARDVANHICKEVFGVEPPYDMPYEFFLVGGAKMSSSKGKGSSAKDMSDLFPPEVFRLALIGKDIREQIDVDPGGESVPRLYDWYDELAESARAGKDDDYARLFELTQLPKDRDPVKTPWQMRFRDVAFVVQMPHLKLADEAQRAKGSALTIDEERALLERADYAKYWLHTYAPENFRYELQKEMPFVELSAVQKRALAMLLAYLSEPRDGEGIHARLHALKTEVPIKPIELFEAIYMVFLARDSGPKAGWFLAGLPLDFVQKRLTEATA